MAEKKRKKKEHDFAVNAFRVFKEAGESYLGITPVLHVLQLR
jgi:hypothetical protein